MTGKTNNDNCIYKIVIGPEYKNKQEITSFLKRKKRDKNYKVIDVGGSDGGDWCEEVVDSILDYNVPGTYGAPKERYNKGEISFFKGDITTEEGWEEILDYVKENGKFDFSICRHTLEDLLYPQFVTDKLEQISKRGWIAVPSKESECRRGYHPTLLNFRGCGHHHWIYVAYNDKIIGLEKMNWIEAISDLDLSGVDPRLGGSGWQSDSGPGMAKQELSFYWKNSIDIQYPLANGTHCLPEDYREKNPNLWEVYRLYKDPWEVWVHFLNKSL
mgnify:CR=1 FL=1